MLRLMLMLPDFFFIRMVTHKTQSFMENVPSNEIQCHGDGVAK